MDCLTPDLIFVRTRFGGIDPDQSAPAARGLVGRISPAADIPWKRFKKN